MSCPATRTWYQYLWEVSVGARDRFEMLFEHSVDGVFFMTLDEPIAWHGAADKEALLDYAFDHLRITSVNRVLCEQIGARREELIGAVPRDRWKVEIDVWRARMRELYDHGRTYFTMRAPRTDERWLDVEGQYVCLYDEQGRITGCFGTQRDVTEKRKTAERLELAVIGGDIGIWDMDLDARTVYFDERWIERLGYSPQAPEVRELAWWCSLVHPSDLAEVRRSLEAHQAGATPLYLVEHRMRKANGEWIWLLTRGKATGRDTPGAPARVVGACLDITERKLLQERLFLAERMASIGTLAAGVGHEINNPLTYIVLNLALIDRDLRTLDLPPAAHKRLMHMVEQARYGTERVSGVVRDLQALTRVPEQRTGRVALVSVLERCLEIADHQVRHRARVIRNLEPVPMVLGSEGRVVQLFLNVLVNAAQAIPIGRADKHTITITTATRDGCAVVAIADTGVGISASALGRVFDPFYTTKEVGEGTGLGLAISRSIVTAMGGEIEVESTPGVGTTFRMVFPPAPPDADPVVAETPAAKLPGKKRVLVIDDEPMVGQLVAKVLVDHLVIAETSGRAALTRLSGGERFDFILCDVMMPEVSGMDFYAELAPELRARIVFLSGGAFTEGAQRFLDSVPNRRLAKPFDVDALTAVLLSSGDHDALP